MRTACCSGRLSWHAYHPPQPLSNKIFKMNTARSASIYPFARCICVQINCVFFHDLGCVPPAAVAVSPAMHNPLPTLPRMTPSRMPSCHAHTPLPHMPPAMHAPRHTSPPPPVDRMIDMCKNITFPQTSFEGGNNYVAKSDFRNLHLNRIASPVWHRYMTPLDDPLMKHSPLVVA